MSWEPLVDTSQSAGRVSGGTLYAPGEVYRLQAHSFALFINRAPRQEVPPQAVFATGVVSADDPAPGQDDATPR